MEIFNTLFPNNGSYESMFGLTTSAVETDITSIGNDTQQEINITNQRTLNDVKAFDEYCLSQKNMAMEIFNLI